MGNALWLDPYMSDLATLTGATAASASLGLTNLQGYEPTQKYRSTSLSSQFVQADFTTPGAVACNAVAFISTNLTNGATIRVRASNTDPVSAAAFDQSGIDVYPGSKSTQPGWPHHIAFAKWTNSTAYLKWRIDFTDGSNPDGYLEHGRMMLGAYLQPAVGLDMGVGRDFASADMRDRMAYNKAMLARRGNVARLWTVVYNYLERTEAERGFARLSRLRGNGGDLFFTLDPDETTYFPEYSGQFTIEQLQMPNAPFVHPTTGQGYAVRAQLLEVV